MKHFIRFSAGISAVAHLFVIHPASAASSITFACELETLKQERARNYPHLMLTSIARTESGRKLPVRKLKVAWPWSINVHGHGFQFETKATAVAVVKYLLNNNVRSIDVGCMQVNLKHHPTAFKTIEQAFDPAANVDYAATFLGQLLHQYGTWRSAVSHYHSDDPNRQSKYLFKVVRSWYEIKSQHLVD
ncbi:MAG: transglycosylase SLT domain-containing protein [Alphaproteobacteria bacterium]|nr:transglycosylase SLT domain-containing protein [Alphaproteobacteria bacterium]